MRGAVMYGGKKMTGKNLNVFLGKLIGIRPIAYNVWFTIMTGSVYAGLFLSQLLYWYGKGIKPGWVYKTIEGCYLETGLKRSQQDKAIKILTQMKILEKKRMGLPPKRYFKINLEVLLKYHCDNDVEQYADMLGCVKLFLETKQQLE